MRTFYLNRLMRCMMISGILSASICGCKKFVQLNPPSTEVISQSVFNDDVTATAAVIGIYDQMFLEAESWAMAQDQGLLADELTSHSTNTIQREFYTNSMTALNSSGEWNNGYNYIYQANAIIAGLQNNGNIPSAIAQQLTGEAKFVRAYWNFILTNQYGDVPLVTTTDYTINKSISRTPSAQVFAAIIQDLKDAEGLLNSNFVDLTDTTITTERTRPTQAAAQALLARVYLYAQKYDSAEAQASLVINNNLFSLCTNLSPLSGPNSVFLMNSSEAIWQLATPLPTNINTQDAQAFILTGAPSNGTYFSTTISPELLNAFELGDQRKTNWIGVDSITTSTPTVYYYFPYKYQAYNTPNVSEYTMVLRLAEQYLIRAEARANQQGNTNGALADLNMIRQRAGLNPYAGPTDQASLIAAIIHERQVELFTEWGHRWFDLKRTGTLNAVLGSPGNVCQAKGGVWNPNSALYPIAQNEILNDGNLSQNPGY